MNSDKVMRVLRDMKLLMKNELYQADVIDTFKNVTCNIRGPKILFMKTANGKSIFTS